MSTGNAGRGVKEPTLRQSFSLSPFDLGNTNLEAERSRALDAGIRQRLFHDRVSVEATWFDNRFEQQISTRTISFSPYQAQYFNVGLTRARGAELVAEIAPTDGIRLSGSYTFTDSEIVAALKAKGIAPMAQTVQGRWPTFILFEEMRKAGYRVRQAFTKDSLKVQLEEANRLGAKYSLILGQKELIDGTIIIRDMESGTQEVIDQKKIYVEINNFYTPTVYDKGAEVIRMIHTLLGKEGFRRSMDKYFELFDGQAVTTNDFIHAMSAANNNYDFSQFEQSWYHRAGTPRLEIKSSYQKESGEYQVFIRQLFEGEEVPFHMPYRSRCDS